MNKREVGSLYEDMAARYIESLGFKILERNFRCRLGEIDIIAKEGETIVFLEVKYRSSEAYGYPSEAVNYRKQQKIIRTGEYFLLINKITDLEVRFDVVEILPGRIHLIRNSFGGAS